MPHPVIDLGSNLEENLERWSNALKRGGDKLAVFKTVYSGKTKQWTAQEISEALGNKLSPKRVTMAGRKLDGDSLIRQVQPYPVVYEKIQNVHHYKSKILSLLKSKARRAALPTKRKTHV